MLSIMADSIISCIAVGRRCNDYALTFSVSRTGNSNDELRCCVTQLFITVKFLQLKECQHFRIGIILWCDLSLMQPSN